MRPAPAPPTSPEQQHPLVIKEAEDEWSSSPTLPLWLLDLNTSLLPFLYIYMWLFSSINIILGGHLLTYFIILSCLFHWRTGRSPMSFIHRVFIIIHPFSSSMAPPLLVFNSSVRPPWNMGGCVAVGLIAMCHHCHSSIGFLYLGTKQSGTAYARWNEGGPLFGSCLWGPIARWILFF